MAPLQPQHLLSLLAPQERGAGAGPAAPPCAPGLPCGGGAGGMLAGGPAAQRLHQEDLRQQLGGREEEVGVRPAQAAGGEWGTGAPQGLWAGGFVALRPKHTGKRVPRAPCPAGLLARDAALVSGGQRAPQHRCCSEREANCKADNRHTLLCRCLILLRAQDWPHELVTHQPPIDLSHNREPKFSRVSWLCLENPSPGSNKAI